MSYFIICTDRPKSLKKRLLIREKHINYLNKFKSNIITAGPLLDSKGNPYGSLLIVNFTTISEVRDFLNNDPYNLEKLFKDVEIKKFKKQNTKKSYW